MTRERSLAEAFAGVEKALRMLEGCFSKPLSVEYVSALRRIEVSVDALVLAGLLRRGVSVPMRRVLEVLADSGEDFTHYEAMVDAVGDQEALDLVLAEFVRGVMRFEHRTDGSWLYEYQSVGWVRLNPHLLGVVKEYLDSS